MTELLAAGREAEAELRTLRLGSRTMAEWARSTAVSTSWSSCSRRGVVRIATMSNLAASAETAAMCGAIRGHSFSRKTEEGTCWRSIDRQAGRTGRRCNPRLHRAWQCVLDGFLGSGTTVIAAERTGRRGFGRSFDPAYVDTIIRRWQKLTGDVARHIECGRTFDDLACEAEVADAAEPDTEVGT